MTEYIPEIMQYNPEKQWEIIVRLPAKCCSYGSGSHTQSIAEKCCTHPKNNDPYREIFITFGRCIQAYCPLNIDRMKAKDH